MDGVRVLAAEAPLNRSEAVEALGRELLSYLPQPRSPSSLLQTPPGPAPGRRVPCTACGSRGRLRSPGRPCIQCPPRRSPARGPAPWATGHGCQPCLACEGTGWRRARAGEEPVDEYVSGVDQRPYAEADDLARRLERTERLLQLWLSPESLGFQWEQAKERVWATGSFAELDEALRQLAAILPRRFSLWWRVIVLDEPLQLSDRARVALQETSTILANWMPHPIRVPRRLRPERKARDRKTSLWRGQTAGHEAQRQERNALIAHQASLGWSAAKIAAQHGLTKRRVNQILQKEEVAA